MTCQVRLEQLPCCTGYDGTVYVLESGDSRALIWPAMGFNCLSWQIVHQGQAIDLLWSDLAVFKNPQPTRNGFPILFPFPNRIRDGRFTWNGQSYQLPINGPQNKHAIHGFACYRPWRIAGWGTRQASRGCKPPDDNSPSDETWLRAAFQVSRDAPECENLWPADYIIEIEYVLTLERLRMEIAVKNPDAAPLPFGVGFHPYFRFPLQTAHFYLEDSSPSWPMKVERWALDECLPASERVALEGTHRLVVDPRAWPPPGPARHELQWDDAYRLEKKASTSAIARLVDPSRSLSLRMTMPPEFRDLVVFTPPHRQAVCLEPYTCVTDAINLHQRGIDTGLMTLPPGETWQSSLTMDVNRKL